MTEVTLPSSKLSLSMAFSEMRPNGASSVPPCWMVLAVRLKLLAALKGKLALLPFCKMLMTSLAPPAAVTAKCVAVVA